MSLLSKYVIDRVDRVNQDTEKTFRVRKNLGEWKTRILVKSKLQFFKSK